MNRFSLLILTGASLSILASCKEKKQSDIIITSKPVEVEAPKGTQEMSPSDWSNTVEWLDQSYTISIRRYVDKELPEVKDEQGRKYYDNKIDLKITRQDGSSFMSKTFTKDSFREYIDNAYGRKGALLGLAFDHADDSNLYFGASVGSPDVMSDEYVPLSVTVSKSGNIKIKASTQLDTGGGSNDANREDSDDEEDGV